MKKLISWNFNCQGKIHPFFKKDTNGVKSYRIKAFDTLYANATNAKNFIAEIRQSDHTCIATLFVAIWTIRKVYNNAILLTNNFICPIVILIKRDNLF